MPKTITNAFKTAWVNKGCKFGIQRVDYKRRYWNGSAMVYESSWQSMTMPGAQFSTIGSMSWGLSSILNTEFDTSNCSVQLLNSDYQWTPQNTLGIFGQNSLGYNCYPRGTKFQVYAGYELSDHTYEYVSMFAGLLTDYTSKPEEGIFEAYISGYEEYLKNTKAEIVSDTFTLENCSPATGDGTNTDFRTTSAGVGYITVVQVNGVTVPETDYSISDLDNVLGASITFNTAPGNTFTVKATGFKWKANQGLDTLAGLLCDASGVIDRTIDPVVISGGASGSKTIDLQADWLAGTLSGIDATTIPGSIVRQWRLVDDFSDGDLTTNPVWSATNLTAAVVGGKMKITGVGPPHGYIQIPLAKNAGTWEWKTAVATADGADILFVFCDGYALFWRHATSEAALVYASTNGLVNGATQFTLAGTGEKTFRITRSAAGVMTVMVDGVLKDTTLPDITYSTASLFYIDVLSPVMSRSPDITFDDFYFSDVVDNVSVVSTTGVWTSAVQDIFSTPTAWATLLQTETLNGATVTYATASSNDGITFDAFVDTVGGIIQSVLRQYFKIRITITAMVVPNEPTPQIDKVIANFVTSTVTLAIAVFKGMDCYTAMQQLAATCNYEIGFDSSGSFFFRARTNIAAPSLIFNQADILARVTEIKPGWNEIINDVQVPYGGSYKNYNSASLPETAPTSEDQYFKRPGNGNTFFILANDASLALGLAQSIHDEWYRARRRVQFECRLIPQAEVGDVVEISFFEDPLLDGNIFGDPLITWAPIFGLPTNVALRSFRCRIIELTHDFDTNISRILGLEVLS